MTHHDYLIARIIVDGVPVIEERLTEESVLTMRDRHVGYTDMLDEEGTPWKLVIVDPDGMQTISILDSSTGQLAVLDREYLPTILAAVEDGLTEAD